MLYTIDQNIQRQPTRRQLKLVLFVLQKLSFLWCVIVQLRKKYLCISCRSGASLQRVVLLPLHDAAASHPIIVLGKCKEAVIG